MKITQALTLSMLAPFLLAANEAKGAAEIRPSKTESACEDLKKELYRKHTSLCASLANNGEVCVCYTYGFLDGMCESLNKIEKSVHGENGAFYWVEVKVDDAPE